MGNSVSTTSYTAYDALGRVTAGNQNTDEKAYPFRYAYNALGLTSMRYPSTRTVNYTYDGAGRPYSATGTLGSATDYVSSVSYAPHGAVSSMNLHNGVVETTAYNSRLPPSLMEATNGGSLWKLENFYCDPAAVSCTSNNGNVIWQRLTAPPKPGYGTLVLTTTYGYDAANRIASAKEHLDSLTPVLYGQQGAVRSRRLQPEEGELWYLQSVGGKLQGCRG
jgi:YD repeat-containing protein